MDAQFVDRIINSLNISRELLLEFVIGFSRFEYAMKAAGFVKRTTGLAEASWPKLEDWLETLPHEELAPLLETGQYLLVHPPKKLVLVDGAPKWEVRIRREQTEIRFLAESLKQARNNLFHGGKWLTASEPKDRNQQVISTGASVLRALVALPSAYELRRHFNELP